MEREEGVWSEDDSITGSLEWPLVHVVTPDSLPLEVETLPESPCLSTVRVPFSFFFLVGPASSPRPSHLVHPGSIGSGRFRNVPRNKVSVSGPSTTQGFTVSDTREKTVQLILSLLLLLSLPLLLLLLLYVLLALGVSLPRAFWVLVLLLHPNP